MLEYTVYECKICRKKSKDRTEITKCEASHMKLSPEEYTRYQRLKKNAERAGRVVSIRKNEETDWNFDKAVLELLLFEREHGLNGF